MIKLLFCISMLFCLSSIAYAGEDDVQLRSSCRLHSPALSKSISNGEVFHAPIWIGYRRRNTVMRVGVSEQFIQSETQNRLHKYMKTPYFNKYNNFKSGPFSYCGYYNPLTLWNN